MTASQMSICYHPITVVLVDDNEDFLARMKESLLLKDIPCLTYNDPDEALIFLEGLPFQNKLSVACEIDEEDNSSNNTKLLNLSLKPIYEEVYNQNRFEEVGIVIADYQMPQLKGDSFFGILSNRYMKRIMLTGGMDLPMAVRLLNQRLIDNFIEKKPLMLIETLLQQIESLKLDYFNQLSASISGIFNENPYVSQTDYYNLVSSKIKEHNIVEHYTFSKTGSKFMIDQAGKIYALVIATEEELNGYCNIADFADLNKGGDFIQKLKSHTHMPFLFTDEESELSPQQWESHLIPIQPVELNDTSLYYGFLPTKKLGDKKTLSFRDFLKQVQ